MTVIAEGLAWDSTTRDWTARVEYRARDRREALGWIEFNRNWMKGLRIVEEPNPFVALERFNIRIADEAFGDAKAYDRLLVENADEARTLIAAAKAALRGGRHGSPGMFHYIEGIERRLHAAGGAR